jgi:hypothetical protein
MSEPFIFIGTHSIREAKLQDLKQYEQELVALVEANEPRLMRSTSSSTKTAPRPPPSRSTRRSLHGVPHAGARPQDQQGV